MPTNSTRSVPAQPVGKRCISFEVRGRWGHFRRIEGNIVKQTYRLMPRTTISGMLAAILGIPRDCYYDTFGPDVSGVAIEPLTRLRTMNIPENVLSTAKENIQMYPSRGYARIGLPKPVHLRQQHNYEMLVDPAYRIDVWLDDQETFDELEGYLERGESHYPPSLGLSECLAKVEYLGTTGVEQGPSDSEIEVDSAVVEAVDSVLLSPNAPVRTERSPGYMETDDGGRTTSEFTAYAFSPQADTLRVRDVPTAIVDGRTVMFS